MLNGDAIKIGRRTLAFFLLLLVAVFPFLFQYTSVASEVLIFAIFALGFNLLLGYTGILSFGHAAYFGLGAYACGVSSLKFGFPLLLSILFGIVTAGIAGIVVGYLLRKKRGVYFAMITLAIAQSFYFIALQFRSVTGGSNGLGGMDIPKIVFPGNLTINLGLSHNFYYFALIILIITLVIYWKILRSPYGKVLRAIRENEKRAEACGYNTNLIRIIAFTISSSFAGLAGALYALHLNFVPLDTLHWVLSGEIIMITLLGGQGTFWGPLIGATVFIGARESITSFTARWEVFLGALLVFIVLALPGGISGAFSNFLNKVNDYINEKEVADVSD